MPYGKTIVQKLQLRKCWKKKRTNLR